MARIDLESLKKDEKNNYSVQDKVFTKYYVFEKDGARYLQFDMFGSKGKEAKSATQVLQIDSDLAKFLADTIKEEFNIGYSESLNGQQTKATQLNGAERYAGKQFGYFELPEVFQNNFARRYITSLLAKPFVILTGNSGTGKTRISKQFAEYLQVTDENGKKNWALVPVGADWTDNVKVLGYYNPLADNGAGKYEKTEIVELMERANAHPSVPYFLLLDEMNLSHVERYFADFLSKMETPDQAFELAGYAENDGKLQFPDNLFVVGTVNIDETTYMFSPKVLDRANVVEFKPDKDPVLDLFEGDGSDVKISPANDGTAQGFMRLARELRQGANLLTEEEIAATKTLFGEVYTKTEECGFEFAFRTVREIRQYLNAALTLRGAELDEAARRSCLEGALDEQLLQKIMPKIHGNRREIGALLNGLKELCAEKELKLPLSEEKVLKMKDKLEKTQYASFI